MTEFMNWLRAEMLRLKGFDWSRGSWRIRWLKDGVPYFSSYYPIERLAVELGLSESEILGLADSPGVATELEGQSFTMSWTGDNLILSWLEPGIKRWKVDVTQHYTEDDGSYYVETRKVERVIYVDGKERVVSDSGEGSPVSISKNKFIEAQERIQRGSI
jgi:hypothetical protein